MADPNDVRPKAIAAIRAAWRGLRLVASTSRGLTALLVVATVVGGLAPVAAAYVARVVVDAVVAASAGDAAARSTAFAALAVEAAFVAAALAATRGITYGQALLKVRLAHVVHRMILAKATSLGQADFEDPEVHDRIEESRREATVRPLSLVSRTFTLLRYALALAGYATILIQLSVWAVVVVALAGVPAFLAEARISREAFRFFRRHTPENRERHYIETLLTREENAKEVGFFGLGPRLLGRYDALFARLYAEDRRIERKRHAWGLGLGLLGTVAFFGGYVWIAVDTIEGILTLGQMTMYVVVFRQGQTAVASALTALGGIYEDALYLLNLEELVAHPATAPAGTATRGPRPEDGLRVEALSWTYPGAREPALRDVSFHVRPGETIAVVGHNGSGKSTLVKLLTRRYVASSGRVLLEGRDLREWSIDALRARIGILFQDYNRYKLLAGENIGAGDPSHFDDRSRWTRAARLGLAEQIIEDLPQGYETRLGKSFRGATELSGGQWQRLAFARALMRPETQLLVFDEPTSAADPARQAELDHRLAVILEDRMGLVVTHRLATARIANRILVLDAGRVREEGTHEELLAADGLYASLFQTQARAYR
ncbi:MAG: ABC transporter ATP-binding protein [Sandaracinaceae bacterium]